MGLEPSRLSDYRLNDAIGSGATAQVFDATHTATGQQVAIKILEAGARSSDELKERLAREAVMLAEVTSLHVGRILGFGYNDDQPFLVLERLRGETLDDLLRREGSPTTAQLIAWMEQLLIGVRDCHAVGIIHRDIKPANIFLEKPSGQDAYIKLIDFGVARLRDIASVGVSLTSTHHLIGSMGYMAPEQFQSAKGVGPPADLYAVGVVLFRAISGTLPFVSRSLEKVIRMKCEHDSPLLSSLPHVVALPLLDAFCARALSRTPQDRFQTASEMLEAWWRVTATIDADSPLTIEGLDFLENESADLTATNASPEIVTLTNPDISIDVYDGGVDSDAPTREFPPMTSPASGQGVGVDGPASPGRVYRSILASEIELHRKNKGPVR